MSRKPKVTVIDNYDSFTYNLVQRLGELGAEIDVLRNDAVTVDDLVERKPERLVLSPGPCTPNEAGICLATIRRFCGLDKKRTEFIAKKQAEASGKKDGFDEQVLELLRKQREKLLRGS